MSCVNKNVKSFILLTFCTLRNILYPYFLFLAGESCQVFDVAVSTQFFSKIVTEPLFGDFFLNVASSLLNQKYGLVFKPDGK